MKKQGKESTFKEFGLQPAILEAVEKCGFTKPTEIQAEVIPLILEGKDVVAQAQTGTGKTAAFGLPGLELIYAKPAKEGMLVITPTRELAIQVSAEIGKYGKELGIKTVAVYGGDSAARQIEAIHRGAHVVVATPGRLLDLLESKRLKGFAPSIVVLDEADEMLNMGFLEDVQAIFQHLPEERQTLLFSATLSDPIQKLIRKILKDPLFVTVGNTGFSHQDIEHIFYDLKDHRRETAFFRILHANQPGKAIIFCRTKKDVDDLSAILAKTGFSVKCLHGDIEQSARERVTASFRKGEIKFLVATDVAARGLDISDITHIFNYQIPFGGEEYVHRAGRTGRAGKKGIAVTVGTANELRKLGRMLGSKTDEVIVLPVPTAEYMYNMQMDGLVDLIAKQQIRENVTEIIEKLGEKVDSEELLPLLLSYIIDKEKLVQQKEEKVAFAPRRRDERSSFGGRREGDRFPSRRRDGERSSYPRREGDRPTYAKRREGERSSAPRSEGDRPTYQKREGDKSSYPRKEGDRPSSPRRTGAFKPREKSSFQRRDR